MVLNNPVRDSAVLKICDQRRHRRPGTEKQGFAHIAASVDHFSGSVPAGLSHDIGNIIILFRLKHQIETSGTDWLKLF